MKHVFESRGFPCGCRRAVILTPTPTFPSLHAMKTGLIGCGRMGGAIVEGALKAGAVKPEGLLLSSRTRASAEALARKTGGQPADNNLQVARECDLVLLGCKPPQVVGILGEISPALPGGAVLVSVAAGITLASMESACPPGTRVIRAMPNTPCMVGMGATGIAAGSSATGADIAMASALFASVGLAVTTTEPQLDAVTGLSGSGPAYIYTLVQALADQGAAEGLEKSDALRLAVRTVMGAAHMLESTGKSPQQLIDQVTSPGGTTLAGLAALAEHGFGSCIAEGVRAATARSREISEQA